jgi:NADH-quinone oxidoreductase subunit J
MDLNIIMYVVFGLLAIAGGAALFIARHPIRGALGLLGSMLALAGMYATLHVHAIAAFQVIIYAGAVMVLITYIIMLLDIRTEDFIKPFSRYYRWGVPLVLIFVIFLIVRFAGVHFSQMLATGAIGVFEKDFGTLIPLGKELIVNYLFVFEYVSTLLFAAIVAVIALVQMDWKGRKKHES